MGLPRLIEKLLDGRSWPGEPATVELLQTHVSYIFLTPDHAYKVKKPVDFGFLDFTTLERRLHYCNEEVRLNRRLTTGVYLDVIPITETDGAVKAGGDGEPVEYAVRMKRLPDSLLLSNLIKSGEATPEMIRKAARRIASFHAQAETSGHIGSFGTAEAIRTNTDENFEQTAGQVGTVVSREAYETIRSFTDAFLAERADLFARRVEGGFIRDCHGDIHADHVSITDGIDIFDCIEFNERFRYSDVVSDVAFLAMDLDFRNRHDLAETLVDEYFSETGDAGGRALLDFYQCYRAYVRGKVDGFKATELEVPEAERVEALLSAKVHYHLSRLYASGGFRPMLVVVCGLSGTGKSTVAARIARAAALVRLSSDEVRRRLAGLRPDEHAPSGFGRGIYATNFTERTYVEMLRRASDYLFSGRSVVLDATFTDRKYLEKAAEAAERGGFEFSVVECTAPDGVVRERLNSRASEPPGGVAVSDAGWEIYLEQKKRARPMGVPHTTIDTGEGVEKAVDAASGSVFG